MLTCDKTPDAHCQLGLGLSCYGYARRGLCARIAKGDKEAEEYVRKQTGDPENPDYPCKRVVFATFLNSFSGFGRFTWKLGAGLDSIGVDVAYESDRRDERYAKLDPWLKARRVQRAREPWRLVLDYTPIERYKAATCITFTMHETTRLQRNRVLACNTGRAVIVPTAWNAQTFADSGVTRPIHVCPLGYDPGEGWAPAPKPNDGKFRVLMIGMLPDGGVRKLFPLGIKAFLDAFPTDADVELTIKIWPGCLPLLHVPYDPRIRVIAESWPIADVVKLVQRSDVLLNPTASEGWGLTTLEAMACGTPAIVTMAGAHADFITKDTAYVVGHRTEAATGYYAGQGEWFPPVYPDLVRRLRDAKAYPEIRARVGESAARQATFFTWRHSAVKLRQILWDIGMLAKQEKPRVPLDRSKCVPCQAAKQMPSRDRLRNMIARRGGEPDVLPE